MTCAEIRDADHAWETRRARDEIGRDQRPARVECQHVERAVRQLRDERRSGLPGHRAELALAPYRRHDRAQRAPEEIAVVVEKEEIELADRKGR